MSAPQNELTGHEYDGIEEYDNPLPGWWSTVFALSAVFAVFYVVYFHMGDEGLDDISQYDAEAAEVMELRFGQLGTLTPDRATLLKYKDDKKWLAAGRAAFQVHCVSCHGKEGGGLVGVNLTDDHYKHITNIEDIVKVIEDGAAGGAMPAWKNRITNVNQLVLTAAYVASLRGTNAPGGKAAEGKPIPAWDAAR
ncbi:MAG: cbb3-type cytochrome c oxidase N-terminal domain-containing protein [Nannocystales bacterium]